MRAGSRGTALDPTRGLRAQRQSHAIGKRRRWLLHDRVLQVFDAKAIACINGVTGALEVIKCTYTLFLVRRKSQAGSPPVKRVFVMIVITAPGSDRLPAGPMRGNPLPPGICHSADRCFHATPPSVCRMMPAEITGAKVWLVERTRMEYLRSSSLPLHRPGIGPQRCALWVRADADATERKGRWGSCFW
jgi:hypothetical protein